MNRSVVGSLLFVGGAMLVVLAPSGESAAQDLDGPTRGPVTATDIAPSPASLGIPFAAPAAPAHIVAASAGLKGLETPDLTLSANCGENQVEVDGDYCPALEQKCVRWMDPETTVPRRCSEFAPTGKCQGKTVKKHFCIDKYEWPNKAGEMRLMVESACLAAAWT